MADENEKNYLTLIREKLNKEIREIVEKYEEESTVVTGWVCLWEGVHEDNRRSLTYISADSFGDELPPWSSRGFLHHAIDNVTVNLIQEANEDEDEEEDEDSD